MNDLTVPIVGAKHRPPAQCVLNSLPQGQILRLEPEPTNIYDPKAIRVLVATAELGEASWANIEQTIGGSGYTLAQVRSTPIIFLGYIPNSDGPVCARWGWKGNREVAELVGEGLFTDLDVRLGFTTEGQPVAAITCEARKGGKNE
jgi:hypothetical protein